MLKRTFLFLALIASALVFTGCFDSDVDDTSVPWSRPTDWERGAPGFGGSGFR